MHVPESHQQGESWGDESTILLLITFRPAHVIHGVGSNHSRWSDEYKNCWKCQVGSVQCKAETLPELLDDIHRAIEQLGFMSLSKGK